MNNVHIFHVPTKSVHRFGKFRWMTCSKQWGRHHSLHELVNLIPDHEYFGPVTVWECPWCRSHRDYKGEAHQ